MEKKYFQGKPEEILGRQCAVDSKNCKSLETGYIIGFKEGRYEIRLIKTGIIMHTNKVMVEM